MCYSNIASRFGFRSWFTTTDDQRAEPLSACAAILIIGALSLALWGFVAEVVVHFV